MQAKVVGTPGNVGATGAGAGSLEMLWAETTGE